MPGTAAESGLRVKSRTALPSVDFTPIWLTQVYQKGDKNLLFQVHFGLWACRSHWERVLCCSVSSYRNADSVSPLICNTFCFPCKKKKCFLLFTLSKFLCCLLLAFPFSLYCTVTPFCKMVLIAVWAPVFWLLCTPITCFFICNASGVKTWLPWIPQTLASWRQIGSV